MSALGSAQRLRAEHASLDSYLHSVLEPEQLKTVLLTSFNQWDFALGALADISLCLRDMGSAVRLAFWADQTPVHDVGWTTSDRVSKLFRSPARDARVREALIRSGIPPQDFVAPPLDRWKPRAALNIPQHLNRSSIRAMTYRDTSMGRAILQVHPDRETPVNDHYVWPRRWVEAAALSYAYVYDQALEVIDHHQITALVAYNGRFLHDRAAAAAAESRGIPVLNYDTGGSQTDFDLTIDATHDWSALQDRMLRMYEHWPVEERDELGSSWFIERVNHEDPINAPFIEAQRKGHQLALPDGVCTVGFFSSSGDEIAELELDWDAYFAGQPAALRLLSDLVRKREGYQLVVRSHPHMRLKPRRDLVDWMAEVERANPHIHVDPFSEIDSYELMRQVDIVVTYGSTTGVEAAFAGKPVIVMGPCAYDELGCATPVSDEQELDRALTDARVGWWPGAVSYGLMMKRRGFNYAHVNRDSQGQRSLAGLPLQDPSQRVLDISHALNRFQRWNLTRS